MEGSLREAELNSGLPRWIEAPIAGAALVAVAPVLLAAGLVIRATSRGPAVFRQQRLGRNGRPFTMWKLRTMRQAAGPLVTAEGDARVTPIGRVLRKTKIDELLTLWNVVRGDMRLVGPRPEVPHLVNTGNTMWREVLQLTPGITDPVTASLRNEEAILRAAGADWQRFYQDTLQPFKLRGYLEYQRNRTWRTDIEVLLGTVVAVVRPRQAPSRLEDALKALAEAP
jgi:lipopolysaccharide/colanic/teichoic acid biosynthesis glycosyltransferase